MLTTKDLRLRFLGAIPVLEDQTGILKPQEIASLSALLTFKGRSVEDLRAELIKKGKDIKTFSRNVLFRSSLRGHASMATTPALAFAFEGSKFLDSALTGMTFASGLMSSGRRTNTETEEIVFPTSILKAGERTKEIYRTASEKNITFVQDLLSSGVSKDEASKMLPYGIYGTGIEQFSLEALVALKREYESQKTFMPEEVGLFLEQTETELEKLGMDLLYWTRLESPKNNYPYPNIFKDPGIADQTWELGFNFKGDFKIIAHALSITDSLVKKLCEISACMKSLLENGKIKEEWPILLEKRRQLCRDNQLAVSIKIFSRISWRVWGEKKRHRTVPMVVSSVYRSVDRAWQCFREYAERIKTGRITDEDIEEIERIFSIPPTIRKEPQFLYPWLERAGESLKDYSRLLEENIPPRDAVFVVPRGVKFDVLQEYNLFNLVDGYYPLRLCSTAEEEMRRISAEEVKVIKRLLGNQGADLADHIVPKCQIVGFCPEEKTCGVIRQLRSDYTEEVHQEMLQHLEKKFR
jgi:thymidylate synthase (FAD)